MVHELHVDDIAERWWDRSFDLPDGVSIRIETMGNNPERVRAIAVMGEFRVESLREAAESERYVDQADVWDLSFPSVDDSTPERGSNVDTCSQGGTTDRFVISTDVRRTLPSVPAPPSVPSPSFVTAPTGSVTIGELVPVERFDESDMLVEHLVSQLEVIRSGRHDVHNLLMLRPVDDATAMFGAPPGFLPVLGTMVDGGTIGHMADAEELGRLDPQLVLYELTMEGAVPADNRYVLTTVLSRSLNSRWPHGEEPAAAVTLAAELDLELRDGLGDLGFSSGVKRRRPNIGTTGWKWRNDSSGNGVVAPKQAWGTESIRKPTSFERALDAAAKCAAGAPASAVYCAQEALVFANRSNDVTATKAAYTAMVEPLRALGRPRVAARADALAQT